MHKKIVIAALAVLGLGSAGQFIWDVDIHPDVYDHPVSLFRDPGPSDSLHQTTVQIVAVPYGTQPCNGDTCRFEYTTMDELRIDARDPARLCRDIWCEFREQPLLDGRSGVILNLGGVNPIILTSDHGRGLSSSTDLYVIIGRHNDEAIFKQEGETHLSVPATHVRQPDCVLACGSGDSGWMLLRLQDGRDGVWGGGLELADAVSEGDKLVASFHPLGLPVKISDPTPVEVKNGIYFIDVDYAPNASGGALINEQGKVAGVVVKSERRTSGYWGQYEFAEGARLEAGSEVYTGCESNFACIQRRAYRSLEFTPVQAIEYTTTQTNVCRRTCASAGGRE